MARPGQQSISLDESLLFLLARVGLSDSHSLGFLLLLLTALGDECFDQHHLD